MEQSDSHFEVARLIVAFLEGRLTFKESERLNQWVESNEGHRELWTNLTNSEYLETHLKIWKSEEPDKGWDELLEKIEGSRLNEKKRYRVVLKYAAVVAGLVMVGWAMFFFQSRQKSVELSERGTIMKNLDNEIMPGEKIAKLVLGDGRVINLSEQMNEDIIEDDGTKLYNDNSLLHYTATKSSTNVAVFNTLKVPRGGEYMVTLSDGTKVWLNAESSLKYPVHFDGKERKVTLIGEGYFEVAKDRRRPFKVEAGSLHVEVLGTKFNVSAYPGDLQKSVSLVEGSVQIEDTKHHKDVLLRPGFAAALDEGKSSLKIDKTNIEAALGWKNSMFIFDNESLGSIMKKLSRWYNVTVLFENGVDNKFHFTGRIERYESINAILNLIELTKKVSFRIEGREVRVESYKG